MTPPPLGWRKKSRNRDPKGLGFKQVAGVTKGNTEPPAEAGSPGRPGTLSHGGPTQEEAHFHTVAHIPFCTLLPGFLGDVSSLVGNLLDRSWDPF